MDFCQTTGTRFTDACEDLYIPQDGQTSMGMAGRHDVSWCWTINAKPEAGQPYELLIENEGDHFGVYLTTVGDKDADGFRDTLHIARASISREQLRSLLDAPPRMLSEIG